MTNANRKVEHEIRHEESGLTMQYNERGAHRLIAPDGASTPWASYRSYTALRWKGRLFVGCTDYYLKNGGVFTPEEFVEQTAAGLANRSYDDN